MKIWLVLLVGLAAAAAPPTSLSECPQTQGQVLVELVNAERAKVGLPPYRVNLRLSEAAAAHAKDLASGPSLGHVGSDGSGPDERANRAGYVWTSIGENVAAGQRTPAEVVESWMTSEGHRHNVLDGRFHEVGVGYEPEALSKWGTYWVMDFGTRGARDDSSEPVCNP